jgi:uncharacterized tellurite resistance protein B-like protein
MNGAGPIETTGRSDGPKETTGTAATVRRALDVLHALDPATAEYLNALAFVLMRVADADLMVCDREARCVEEILVDHAGLRPEQAILVVEIARHRCRIADCGSSYGVSRQLRVDLDQDHRDMVVGFLRAVAGADGSVSGSEEQVISQISSELGCRTRSPETALDA